jgi:hypothetical protein
MKTIQELNELIKNRLIEKNGSIKLTENTDIIDFGKTLGFNENQLLFKVLEIQETIDWTEEERKKNEEIELKSKEKNATNEMSSSASSSASIIYCKNCNARNVKENAIFCLECGNKLKPDIKPDVKNNIKPISNTKSILPIVLGVLFGIFSILVLGYNFWGKNYLRDKNAPRKYSIARTLYLRSSPSDGGNYNIIDNIQYGSEILIYDNGTEWVKCKVNGKEGYASPKYMLNKIDFQELNAILADEDTRAVLGQTRIKKALLSYFREHKYIGKMNELIQKELYGSVSTKEVWQLFAKSETNAPNTVYFSKVSNQNSEYKDFACIIKNINTGERKIIMFSFDQNENPKFEGETAAPSVGDISTIEYSYNPYSQSYTLTPIFTSW